MVFAILIHSLDGGGTVYHSQFYTIEGNDANKKKRQQQIIHMVQQEHIFRLQCTKRRVGSAQQGETLAGGDITHLKVWHFS